MKELKVVRKSGNGYTLDRMYVNPENVASIQEDHNTKQALNEGKLPEGMDPNHRFSQITLNTGNSTKSITAVGDPDTIKLKLSGRDILHG